MEVDKWINNYRVRAFPWIDDGKTIYFNVQYYRPGQSLSKPPATDKTVYITNNDAGRNLLENYLDTLVTHVTQMTIPENSKVIITA